MTLFLRRSLRLAALTLLSACAARGPQADPVPRSAEAAFAQVLAAAGDDVRAGRYAAADRRLLDFQQANPAAPEATDAAWYRALYKLDPANAAGSPREATALLDGLIATPLIAGTDSPRRESATALRRVAAALEARPATVTVTTPATNATPARTEDSRGKDDEIARLREELKSANAELERIKRRVATPKP